MMRKVLGFLLVALAIASLALSGCQQATDSTATTSTVTNATVFASVGGRVVGPLGTGLSGVVVSYQTGASSRAIGTVTTDSNGMFEVTGLISGKHTIFIGNGVTSTQMQLEITVPELAALTADSTVSVVDTSTSTTVPASTIIEKYNGHYFVNVDLNTDGTDQFVLYPCTATLTGTAYIKTTSAQNESAASFAPDGTKVFANFASWNNSSNLIIPGKVSGSAGKFTISNVPATYTSSGTITLHLASETATSSAVDSAIVNGVSSNTSGSASVGDSGTLAGDSRDVGSLYFVWNTTPRIITTSPAVSDLDSPFDPGTTTAPTPIVITWDQAMDADLSHGTVSVSDGTRTYNVTRLWQTASVANDRLSLTPDYPFENGQTITVTLTNLRSSDGAWFGTETSAGSGIYQKALTFAVRDSLALVKTSVDRPQSTTGLWTIPTTHTIVLTFNYALTAFDNTATFLYYDTNGNGTFTAGTDEVVNATITIPSDATSTLSINPALDLEYNGKYIVVYKVTDGTTYATGVIGTGAISFTTAEAAAAAAPTLALDTQVKTAAQYNHGNATAFVSFTKGTTGTTYSVLYRNSSTDEWLTDGTIAVTGYDSTTNYATITMSTGAMVSGKTTQVVVLAKAAGSTQTTASNILSITDGTAPVSATITTTANTAYLLSDVIAPYTTFSGPVTSDTLVFFRIGTGGEPILSTSTPTTTVASTVMTIQGIRQVSSSEFWVIANVLANQTITAAATMTVPLEDGEGNDLVGSYTVTF